MPGENRVLGRTTQGRPGQFFQETMYKIDGAAGRRDHVGGVGTPSVVA
jgi:hypothetical protein